MDTGKNSPIIVVVATVSFLLLTSLAFGDVQFRRSEASESATIGADGYPVSRFGHQPVKPATQYQSGNQTVQRAPAGLQYENEIHEQSEAQEPVPPSGSDLSAASEQKAVTTSGVQKDVTKDLDLVPDRAKGIQEIAVIANDLGFFPKTFFVSRDVPVRLFVTGASKNTLCIMMDSFAVRRQVRSQEIQEVTFTPSTPGKYRFYCPVNGMEGTMVVKELASNQ